MVHQMILQGANHTIYDVINPPLYHLTHHLVWYACILLCRVKIINQLIYIIIQLLYHADTVVTNNSVCTSCFIYIAI